jgi:lipopolysaccharide/colanic/teichoic acid biosynthesis glycosyltransferase
VETTLESIAERHHPFNNADAWTPERRLQSRNEFLESLKRERERSDRFNGVFSLMVFEISPFAYPRTARNDFIQHLLRRVRRPDIPGWLGWNRIGLLLPDTRACGAIGLRKSLLESFEGEVPLLCRVYEYPPSPETRSETPAETLPTMEDPEAAILAGTPADLFAIPLPWGKRLFDIVGSLLALILLSPLLLILAILIRLGSPGPVLFRQKRIGWGGKPFQCLKFRTMRTDADACLHTDHVQECMKTGAPLRKLDYVDCRITPFGRFLRRTCLDELPQLINIFKGEMSFVGPRPEVYEISKSYSPWHARRFDATPGLTGLWQVTGKNRTTFAQMMRMDIQYVRRRSLWLDAKILLKTVPAILFQTR